MIGTKLGHYEITNHLGTGGMGEVYQATDAKLRRNVAIKLLPEAFTHDHDRASRFEREAHVLATLNHPNIAAIYGIEEFNGRKFLVMELVTGETLAARLNRGPMPLAEALGIATQITHALEAAHEKNIVHRDLKPANVKITPDGNVKVLDFGLAKAWTSDPADASLSNSPTLSAASTNAGVILGTAAYMSPEQARGLEVDRRTDIFAFGCVLYEMLTGRKAFEGEVLPDILAAVLKSDPDWTRLPSDVPTRVRDLLRVCLEKNPKKRRQTATDVRIDIELASGLDSTGIRLSPPFGARRRERVALVSALALVTLLAALLGAWALRPASTPPEAWLEINTPVSRDASVSLSPDGLLIIFAGNSEGQPMLWLRSINSAIAKPLHGTEGASYPFWKPNSRSIGFFADNKLKRMDLDDGTVKILVSVAPLPLGGAWNSEDTIVFSTNPGKPISRISADGGEASAVTRFDSLQQTRQSSPQFLPDGRHFLFFVVGSPEARGVYVGELGELTTKRLFDAAAPAVYAATGHLIFIREGKLLAQGFDLNRLEMKGSAFPIAEDVFGGTILSASVSGPIAFRTPSADSGQRQLVWFDRNGTEIEKLVYPDTASLSPSLSQDGRRVAVFTIKDGNTDIYTVERRNGLALWDRITSDPGDDIMPLWSPIDGSKMVFGSRRGEMNLYMRILSDPLGSEVSILNSEQPKFPTDWSHDEKFLLFDSLDQKDGYDVWALPMDGQNRKAFKVVKTAADERLAQFSPDDEWIAYQSNKTGRNEIYLQSFHGPGEAIRVSIDGGAQVRWNPGKDSHELFFIAPDDRLMAVTIRFDSIRKTVEPGTPKELMQTNVGRTAINVNRQQYAVSPNARSFVMNSVLGESSSSPIKVILNWKPMP